MRDRTLFFSALSFLLLVLQVSSFCSEKQVSPTFAKDSQVKVERGAEVEISLEAIPDYGNQISFQIQSLPLHGQLSEPVLTSDHTASITYHHDGSKFPLTDEFQFRAQSPGRAKSPPTPVSIAIVPPLPRLSFKPSELDFGALLIGKERKIKIIVTNEGGGRAVGRLLLPKGYSAPEGDDYSLEEGESKEISLSFSPQEERDYAAQVDAVPTYHSGFILLKGKGEARFLVEPKDSLSCVVTNRSDLPLMISFAGDSAWSIPPQTELPPHEAEEFSFQQIESADEDTLKNHSSLIQISDGSSTRTFELPPFQAFIPVTLAAHPPEDLGQSTLGKTFSIDFTVFNRSEMNKTIRWSATSSSGGGMTNDVPLILKGGETKEFHYDWRPTLIGAAELKVLVSEGKQTTHELRWHAVLTLAPSNQSPSMSSIMPTPSDSGADSSQANERAQPALQGTPIPVLDGVTYKLRTTWNGKHNLELRWQGKEGDETLVKLEKRVMRGNPITALKSGDRVSKPPFQLDSMPVQASVSRVDGEAQIREIRDISPGWHLLLLSRFSKEGVLLAQSQLQIFAPSQPSFWSLLKTPLLLLILLFACLFLWRLRR